MADLDLLFHAVEHLCHGGEPALAVNLLRDRVLHGEDFYPTRKLGMHASVRGACRALLGAAGGTLGDADRAFLLQQSGYCGRAIGFFAEAIQDFEQTLALREKLGNRAHASVAAGLLAVTRLYAGQIDQALAAARTAVDYAEPPLTQDTPKLMYALSTLGKVQLHAGLLEESSRTFERALPMLEMKIQHVPANRANVRFRYGDLLLARGRHAEVLPLSEKGLHLVVEDEAGPAFSALLMTNAALAALALGRGCPEWDRIQPWLDQARADYRIGGLEHETIRGEIAWALYLGAIHKPAACAEAFDHAWAIARRGPMKLYMADILSARARLLGQQIPYPWGHPEDDLKEARKLIDECGYHRPPLRV